jgi:hypothetical protein
MEYRVLFIEVYIHNGMDRFKLNFVPFLNVSETLLAFGGTVSRDGLNTNSSFGSSLFWLSSKRFPQRDTQLLFALWRAAPLP